MSRDHQLELLPRDYGSAVRWCFRCHTQPIPLGRTICRRCVLADRNRTNKQGPVGGCTAVGERPDA